jgi:hypothetical protein
MMDIGRFIQKIKDFIPIDDVTTVLEKLPDDPTLKEISKDAPFVGGSIKVALHIIEKVYDAKIPVQKRLSLTLMRIMLESARDSLPYSVSNVKVEEVLGDRKDSEFEDIVLELFDQKYNRDIVDKVITYLPDHPVFTKFRNLLSNEIKSYNDKNRSNTINIPLFLTEFNSNLLMRLEEEKTNNSDLVNMLKKWKTDELVTKLPAGFPAYCIYFPTGMNHDFEIKALARLKEWGKTMGRNLLVADWDIGDISYQIVGTKLGIRTLPSILLTDSHYPGPNDFCILIDDQSLVRDVDKLIEALPNLVNLILTGQSNEVKDAIKQAIKIGQGSKVKSL